MRNRNITDQNKNLLETAMASILITALTIGVAATVSVVLLAVVDTLNEF